MTVSNTNNKGGPYNGDGATTSFATVFKFLLDSEIVVTRLNANGTSDILTLSSDYTVTGAGASGAAC